MSDKRVQEYIRRENKRRGRGPDEEGDGGDDGEERSHKERLRESILDEAKAAD